MRAPIREPRLPPGHLATVLVGALTVSAVIPRIRRIDSLRTAIAFILLASLWSLAFAGFGYAIALKTGNPAAVNSTFLLFFPFLFGPILPGPWCHLIALVWPVPELE